MALVDDAVEVKQDLPARPRARTLAVRSNAPAQTEPLRKPVNTLAIVPQSRRITPLFRKSYNVMLYLAQEQGLERDIYRAPISAILSGLDFDSHDTELVKKHVRAMASTAVEWQSPTTGEGVSWAVSGLIGHAEIKRERGQNWLEWSYSVKLKQELLQPSVFARLSLGIISQLRSHGGIVLYEICSRYRGVGRTSRQPWSWWRPVLSGKPETEKTKALEYRFFKRDVLKTALAEVNAITDIEVELLECREGRFISDLQFVVKQKAQAPLPLQIPPKPLDMSLVVKAQKLGIDDYRAEQLLNDFGDEVLKSGLEALEKRLGSSFPEPLRDPYRYLKSLMPGEAAKVRVKVQAEEARNDPSSPKSRETAAARQAKWTEEWLRKRRQAIVDDLNALSDDEQASISSALLADLEGRGVHPAIRKRLLQSGWRHQMVMAEMVRYYAVGAIGEHWDKPTPEQLLEIAVSMGDQ